MPNLASVLKDEIRRLARKEIREQTGVMRKATAQYRRDIASLKRQVDGQAKTIAFLQKQERRRLEKTPRVEETELSGTRYSAKGLRSHRNKLGLSARDYAALVGVSELTIYNWEQEKTRPRTKQLAALVTVRGIGKRDALKRLEMLNKKA